MAGLVVNLSIGAPIWVDLSWGAVTGGTASIKRIVVMVFEI
jgi:hypothetical protein